MLKEVVDKYKHKNGPQYYTDYPFKKSKSFFKNKILINYFYKKSENQPSK